MKYFLVFCLLLVLGSSAFGREECTEHEKFVQMLEERGETVTMTTQVLFAMQIPTVTKMIYTTCGSTSTRRWTTGRWSSPTRRRT
jgi:hypothetical protein